MRVWICDKSYTIKNSIRSAEHDVCVWIYDKTFIMKNPLLVCLYVTLTLEYIFTVFFTFICFKSKL